MSRYIISIVLIKTDVLVLYLHYFSFQPVLQWYVLSCLWDDAYKRTLAANRKE